jgi:Fe2+ transport system protein FeoA
MRSVVDLAAGSSVTIAQVRGETPELLRYLDLNGLTVGAGICVVAQDEIAGTTTLRVLDSDTEMVIGPELAQRIDVED